MPRAKGRRRRRAGSSGFSLVEVMVAMLIAAVMVTAVLGVAVTARQGGAKLTHRQAFDQAISALSTEVKQYQTACGCLKSNGDCSAPAGACTLILGPNTNQSGAATWSLDGAPGPAGNINDTSFPGKWALACGNHVLKGVVPALEATPYLGGITYNVGWSGGCGATVPSSYDVPSISFTANWTEP